MIALVSVYGTYVPERNMYENFLYTLLKERKPYQSISHKIVPHFDDHVTFIRSKPYLDWYIVQDLKIKCFVGSVYLTHQNEIGIFFLEKYTLMGYGSRVLDTLMDHRETTREFKANIAPANSQSLCFFVAKGFKYSKTLLSEDQQKVVQYTYIKANPYYVSEKIDDALSQDF